MRHIFLLFLTMVLFAGLAYGQDENPFFREWKTPFQVPPFEQIKNEHFKPAFEKGMAEQQAEIEAIVSNSESPTFENTIVAFDNSGALLHKVSSVFYSLNSANTNKEMQEIAKNLSPLTTKHADDISLNPLLFQRIRIVFDQKDNLGLDPVQMRLLTETYKDFIRAGAGLDKDKQDRLRKYNSRIDLLQLTFGQNLLAETNNFKLVIDNEISLSGLPVEVIRSAAETANKDASTKGKWVFTLNNPSITPFMQYSDQRKLKEEIFKAYHNRGNNNNEKDNKVVILELVRLRTDKARLLGYPTWADFALDNRMAKKTGNVYKLLDQVWTPSIAKAEDELKQMQQIIDKERGDFSLEDYDWPYYSEKLKKQLFSLDEESVKPYFKLENVLDGVFYVSGKLYGITFSKVEDAPKYFPDVTLYECKDVDGSHLGVVYFDFHPRAEKRGGAWCGSYRPQSYLNGKRVAPVVTIVTNFSPPAAGNPALLTSDEVETLFHEFGHALNGLLKNVRYQGLSTLPRAFVELPSQIMEHWAFEPDVLKVYAKHYKTGEVIPSAIVKRIVSSSKYGQGFKTTEYLAACYLDMDYHSTPNIPDAPDPIDQKGSAKVAALTMEPNAWVLKFEESSMDKIGLIPQISPRYRSTYFQHSMTGGYTAGYYSYIWAEVLDTDAFESFKETGDIFNREIAAKFRKYILEPGGSKDAMQMYLDFRGREPGIEPLLDNRGLR
jgi:peptidyl-dipeptidase Dcp